MASRSLGTLTLDLIARIGGFQQGMDRAARDAQRSMSQIEQSVQRASSAASASIKALGAAAAAYLGTREIAEYSQIWVDVQNRIKQVSVSQEQFSTSLANVYQVAQNSHSALDATAELYQRIASSADVLGASQEKVTQVTQNISKAMSASGVSAEAAKGALIQLGQAFASGTLRGEELNSVLEQSPGLSQAIANGMGVAVGDLRSLGEAGKLASKAVFDAILSQTQAIDDQFARAQTTIAGAFQVLENSASKAIGTLDDSLGATKAFTEAMLGLSRSLDEAGLQTIVQILQTGLYVALARVGAALISSLQAWRATSVAAKEQAFASSVAASGELRRAEAAQVAASADLAAARQAVTAAQAKVAADRQVMASEVGRIQAVQGAIAAEKLLESQRLKAQITDLGRQQSVARMAELRLAELAITKQLTTAEAQLAAVTVAGSAQMTAALAQRTAATEALAVANGHVTATQLAATTATTAAMGAWFSASTALGAGLVALRTAGAGVLRMAAGWPGLILTVGALAFSFIDFGDKAEAGSGKAADAFEDASTRIRQASRNMLPDNLSGQSYDQLREKLKGLQGQLKEAEAQQVQFQKGVDDKGDVPFESSLDSAKEKAEAIRLAIQNVQKVLNGNEFASSKSGSSYLDSLSKQAVLAGKLTETEKLRAQVQAGILKMSPQDLADAEKKAAIIDKANAALKTQKSGIKSDASNQKAFDTAEENYQRQIELINTTTDARKNATEVAKLQFEIESGKVVGINAQQQKRLESLAAELDSLKKLKQANEDAAKLAAFSATLKDSNQTIRQGFEVELAGAGSGDKLKERLKADLEIQQDYDKQVADLFKQRNAGDISQELYDQETEMLSEALAERMVIQQDYYNQLDDAQVNWMDGVGAAWNDYLDQARNISGQTNGMFSTAFSGMNDALYNFVTTGKLSFSDMAATFAQTALRMLIQWGTAQVAMAALNAFTSTAAIPIVGPFAAPAAAASALGSAGSFMGMINSVAGMAHDGIDSVPQDGTWLLQKGERVTTAETSAKLDRTLDRVSKDSNGSGSGNAPIINVYEDKSRAGQVNTRQQDGQWVIDIVADSFYGEGDLHQLGTQKYGWKSQGS